MSAVFIIIAAVIVAIAWHRFVSAILEDKKP